jgi:MFS family permease
MTAGTLFLFNAFYMLYPTLPLFIKQIGGNEVQVGLSMGAFMLTSVLIRPIVGGLLDRYGRRPFIVWGLMLFILAMYLYDWIGGFVRDRFRFRASGSPIGNDTSCPPRS